MRVIYVVKYTNKNTSKTLGSL